MFLRGLDTLRQEETCTRGYRGIRYEPNHCLQDLPSQTLMMTIATGRGKGRGLMKCSATKMLPLSKSLSS